MKTQVRLTNIFYIKKTWHVLPIYYIPGPQVPPNMYFGAKVHKDVYNVKGK